MSPQRSGGSVIYRLNYDLQKDFEPIGMMSINPQFMVAKKRPETAASVSESTASAFTRRRCGLGDETQAQHRGAASHCSAALRN